MPFRLINLDYRSPVCGRLFLGHGLFLLLVFVVVVHYIARFEVAMKNAKGS